MRCRSIALFGHPVFAKTYHCIHDGGAILFSFKQKHARQSFSQTGEDMIIDHFMKYVFEIPRPSYLDIGANHPWAINNTAFFYTHCKSRGVLVEPNPLLCQLLKKERKHDRVLNVGVDAEEKTSIPFYVMTPSTLSTFDASAVAEMEKRSYATLDRVIRISLLPIMDIVQQHCITSPNIISIDVEGNDLAILQSFDFTICRPEVFIVETIELGKMTKNPHINDFFASMGYIAIADTFINTIFMDKEKVSGHFGE